MRDDRSQVEAVKRALDNMGIDALISALNMTLGRERSRTGRKVLCIWHSEKTASLHIQEKDGAYLSHCHGCKRGGDVLDLVAGAYNLDRNGSDFPRVLEHGAAIAGVSLETVRAGTYVPPPKREAAPEKPKVKPLEDEAFAAMLAPMANVGRLDDGELAADVIIYLRRRGLLELAIAEGWFALPRPEFQPSWVKMLRDVFGKDTVWRSGLVYGEAFAHPEARLCIPWKDSEGKVYTLQRRRLDGRRDDKYVFPFKRTVRTPYGVERLAGTPLSVPVALVEGAIDAVALRALCAADGHACVPLGIPGLGGWDAAYGSLAAGRVAFVSLDNEKDDEKRGQVEALAKRAAGDFMVGGAVRIETRPPQKEHKDWGEVWLTKAA